MNDIKRNNEIKQIIEIMADVEHSHWASWQKYVFSICKNLFYATSPISPYGQSQKASTGEKVIPLEFVKRWQRQIETSYDKLSEQEKDSDRQEAEKIIKALKKNGFIIVKK